MCSSCVVPFNRHVVSLHVFGLLFSERPRSMNNSSAPSLARAVSISRGFFMKVHLSRATPEDTDCPVLGVWKFEHDIRRLLFASYMATLNARSHRNRLSLFVPDVRKVRFPPNNLALPYWTWGACRLRSPNWWRLS
jgi:hypothetical protein